MKASLLSGVQSPGEDGKCILRSSNIDFFAGLAFLPDFGERLGVEGSDEITAVGVLRTGVGGDWICLDFLADGVGVEGITTSSVS